jgi:hypothetical protein
MLKLHVSVLLYRLQGAFAKVIYKLTNALLDLPEDGAEAPKHVRAFVI